MLLHKDRFYGTIVGGTISFTTSKFSGRELVQISVVPTSFDATTGNNYDLTVVDEDGDPIVLYSDVTGILLRNERTALQGVYTVLISGASKNEPVIVCFRTGESQ
jgi:hypothetical protein